MKLMTKALEAKLPALNATENLSEAEIMVVIKFFNPCGSGTWYGIEYDPKERLFFGYVAGLGENELGNFSLDELESVKLPLGLRIERDLYFEPRSLADIMAAEERKVSNIGSATVVSGKEH